MNRYLKGSVLLSLQIKGSHVMSTPLPSLVWNCILCVCLMFRFSFVFKIILRFLGGNFILNVPHSKWRTMHYLKYYSRKRNISIYQLLSVQKGRAQKNKIRCPSPKALIHSKYFRQVIPAIVNSHIRKNVWHFLSMRLLWIKTHLLNSLHLKKPISGGLHLNLSLRF